MTAKQKANRERFKKVVAEAAKLRKKNPKLTQAQAVKQAWAISYGKSKKVGETHKDTKSHNVNIRVVSGFPIDFRGTFGKLKFKIVKQFDIYGKVNAILENINNGENFVVVDGNKNATQLSEQFFKYLTNIDSSYIKNNITDQKFVVNRMKPFFTQLNKDIKSESKKAGKTIKKKAVTKKAVTKTTTKQRGTSNKLWDERYQAMKPGKRKSASGRTYYEYRANRSDSGRLLGIGNLPKYNDPDAAREIQLYADNDNQLYFQRRKPILSNLKKKLDKGTFNVDKAAKLWKYYIDAATQKYNKEFGSRGDKWYELLDVHDRNMLSKEYAMNTLAEYNINKLEGY